MKIWQRGALIGAIWASLGLLFLLVSRIMNYYFYIINLPFIIFRDLITAVNLPKNNSLFFILTLIFWTVVGAVLGHIYQRRAER
ncbi:MAG: hypothetical protein V3U19_07805 [Thermodesulfobacteriota bacterium]